MGDHKDKLPILLVLNKKDLIKPGEIAKKLEVTTCFLFMYYHGTVVCICFGEFYLIFFPQLIHLVVRNLMVC